MSGRHIHSFTKYIIISTCHFLTASERVTTTYSLRNIWHKTVPLIINLFAWRLFQNRNPTFDNLLRRGILQDHQQLCDYMGGCGSNEDINHLFCIVTSLEQFGLWFLIWTFRRNFKAPSINNNLLWLICFWIIRNERNGWICKHKEHIITQLLDKIKLLTYWWLKAKFVTFAFITTLGGFILLYIWMV